MDPQLRLVVSRGWGLITADDLLLGLRALRQEPGFAPDFRHLAVMDAAARISVSTAMVRVLIQEAPFGAGARRAVVTPGDLAFGLGRMYQMLRGGAVGEVDIFRDLDPAITWLELDAHRDTIRELLTNLQESPIS